MANRVIFSALKNQRGVSIVEVVVAFGILSILVFAIMSMNELVFKMSQGVLQRSSVARVIFSIQEDLVKDLGNMPFRDNASFITGANFNQVQYEASFEDSLSQKACYDKDGQPIVDETGPACEFEVRYYRVQEVDRTYTGKDALIPISRILMRVTYQDKNTKSPRVLYLSRLKTHVLNY